MTAPIAQLSVTQRSALKDIAWQESQVVPPGRVMLCRGRKILGYGVIADLAHVKSLTLQGVNTICVSPSDFKDVKEWVG